jgi:hypothetical protein
MSRPTAVASGLVRVTVTSGARRVDLALPGAVCVADLVPELARRVGMLDVATAYAGYRAVARGGRVLRADLGLTDQDIEHGELITIVAGADDEPPRLVDDVVEAMAGVVERDVDHWHARGLRRAALCSAALLLVVGAAGLLTRHGTASAVTASSATAAALIVGAVVSSRAHGATGEALVMANLACIHAAVAGLCWAWREVMSGAAVELAGVGLLAAAVVATVGVARRRLLLLPAVVVGAVCVFTGLLMRTTTVEPAHVLTVLLALVVVASGGFPGLALSAAGGGRHVLGAAAIGQAEPRRIDLDRLASDARLAREILVAASATAGILLVGLTPVAVSGGLAGGAVPLLGSAVVMLRSRRYRRALDVLLGIVPGVLALASTVVSVLWLYGALRFPAAMLVSLGGLVLIGQRLWPSHAAARRDWLAGRLEAAALVALPPVVVLVLLLETL